MDVELQATCSALGYLEGKEYVKEPDCIETVKDLIRFLRRDNDICEIRRQLGHTQILQNDLIPLVKFYHKDKALFDTVIKLLVNLTQPVITCWNNQIPDEKTLRNYCIEVEGYLQDYKEAFVDEEFFSVLSEKIMDILKLNWDELREEDKLQLERLFVLIRNILMIPPDPTREKCTEDDASTHDRILWTIHTSGVEDLILFVASSERERNMLCMHILEIISLMFKEQEAVAIASAGVQRSITEKEKDQKELEQAREKEKAQKKSNILKFSGRHSRFGGTYVIKNMKSISENDVIYHKSLGEAKTFSYDEGKVPKKMAKNRVAIKGDTGTRRSTLSMRLVLKEFCVQFLINSYNPLMRAVKEALTRKTTQDNDETYYLWAMRYFMEFCRLHCKRVDLVGETMSMSSFHYIYTQLCTYYENIRLIKDLEEAKLVGRRTHTALKAYQELLYTLDFMNKSQDEQIRQSAKVIQSNVFYICEYRDIFVTLLKTFKESKCSRSYLRDLVESTHIFLKMLETFSKSSKLVVQKKTVRKKKSAKRKKSAVGAAISEELTEEQLLELWDGMAASEISSLLQGHPELPEGLSPFDAASDVDVNEQRVETMVSVQRLLRDQKFSDAVALFRAAREVWPEREEFGSSSMSQEEELLALKEVFMTSLPGSNRQEVVEVQQVEEEEEVGVEEVNEVQEEELQAVEKSETEFNFLQFLGDFAHQDVVKSYATLLAEFTTNSDLVNRCVVKMLHRLSHDLGFVGMLFQASIFKTFSNLLQGPYAALPRYKELCKFACYVIRQFTIIAQSNRKVFVDLMFWKSKNEALAITSNYDFTTKSSSKVLWTEHDEQELLSLFEKYRDVRDPEKDTVDLIMMELTSNHTRLQVLRELKKQGLITSAKDLQKPKTSRQRQPWTEEEIAEVKQLFEEFKESNNPISDIMKAYRGMQGRSAVMNKLVELGSVDDKTQLMRKRKQKSGSGDKPRRRRGKGAQSSEESEGDSSSDDDSAEDRNDDEAAGEVTSLSVSESAKRVVESGYRNQLAWIQRGLRNTAEDRDEGVFVPTPLVALTEENETAMEDENFLGFLRLIGISPPANEQEVFWRIPAEYSASDLRKIADSLEPTESGEITGGDDIQAIVSRMFPNVASKPKQNRKEKKKKKERKIQKTTQIESEDDSEGEDLSLTEFVPVIPRLAKGSDTSDSGLDSEIEAREQKAIWLQKKGKKSGKVRAEERKDALKRMMERKKARMNRTEKARTVSNSEMPEDDTLKNKIQESQEMEESAAVRSVPTANNSDSDSDTSSLSSLSDDKSQAKKTTEDETQTRSGNKTKSTNKTKKKRFLDSGSESDKSSMSSLSDDQSQSKATTEGKTGTRSTTETKLTTKTRKRFLDSGSESDSNAEKEEISRSTERKVVKKRVRLLASDDEDQEGNGEEVNASKLEESFQLHFSSSEEEAEEITRKETARQLETESLAKSSTESFPATLLTQALDSDAEDDHVPLRAAMKRKRPIEDSDED